MPHRILVVDDEEKVRKSLSGLLEDHGYEVMTAVSGPECLQMMSAHHFDLVILDIVMPEMSGIEVLQKIKERYKDTEVIIITAYADKEKAIATFRLNAYDFIEKPFESKDILNTIAHCLTQLELRKEIEERNRQLAMAEEKYRDLYDNAPDMYHTLDKEGYIIEVNQTLSDALGYSKEELIGRHITEIFTEDSKKEFEKDFPVLLRKGRLYGLERQVVRKDGGIIEVSLNVSVIYDEKGEPVKTRAIMRDISEKKSMENRLQQEYKTKSTILEISSAMREAKDLGETMSIALKKTMETTKSDAGVIFLLDRFEKTLEARVGYGDYMALMGLKLKLDELPWTRVLETGEPHILFDFQEDFKSILNTEIRAALMRIKSGISVLLKAPEEVVGVICLGSYTPRHFDRNEIELLTAISNLLATAIHRVSLSEQLQKRVSELTTIYKLDRKLAALLDVNEIMCFVTEGLQEVLSAEICCIALWDERRQLLQLKASGPGRALIDGGEHKLGEGIIGWAALEQKVVNVRAAELDPRWKNKYHLKEKLSSKKDIPYLAIPMVTGNKLIGVVALLGKSPGVTPPYFTTYDESLVQAIASQVAIVIENARLYHTTKEGSLGAIRALARAIDARDPYTRGHSEEVANYAVMIARALNLSFEEIEMIEIAGLLHDVGKIGTPEEILQKNGPLTPAEWDEIKRHPFMSRQILLPIEPLQKIIPWIYHHHERYNGRGYLDGIKGKEIPLEARILAVADTYSAITSERPYRPAKTKEEAIEELKRVAGTQLDPEIVEAFIKSLSDKQVK